MFAQLLAMALSTAGEPALVTGTAGGVVHVLDTSGAISAEKLPKPWVAAGASAVVPGLGFVYLGEHGRGAAYFGVESLELAAVIGTAATSGYDPDDPATEERLNRVILPYMWLQNTHLVGIYDAWRTARLRHPPGTWRTPTPKNDLASLMRAPLRGRTLLRPEVGIPLGVIAAAGLGFSLYYEGEATFWESPRVPLFSRDVERWKAAAVGEPYWIGTFYPVGIGEEAFFRGMVQTSLEERLGPRWGWILASVMFGALHAVNAPESWQTMVLASTVTGTIGGYLGWLYQRDGYDLSAGAFFHVWYDVIIGTTFFLADPEHQPFSAGITIPF